MLVRIFLTGLALRQNLKILKKLANTDDDDEEQQEKNEAAASGILMFWCIFGFSMLWEKLVEPLVPLIHWVPGYWYLKMGLLAVSAFPQLKVTKFLFKTMLVPALERLHYAPLHGSDGKPADATTVGITLVMFLLTAALAVACPPVASLLPRPGAARELGPDAFALVEESEEGEDGGRRSSHGSAKSARFSAGSAGADGRSGSGSGSYGEVPWYDDDLFETGFGDGGMENRPPKPPPILARSTIFNFNFDLHAPSAASASRQFRRMTLALGRPMNNGASFGGSGSRDRGGSAGQSPISSAPSSSSSRRRGGSVGARDESRGRGGVCGSSRRQSAGLCAPPSPPRRRSRSGGANASVRRICLSPLPSRRHRPRNTPSPIKGERTQHSRGYDDSDSKYGESKELDSPMTRARAKQMSSGGSASASKTPGRSSRSHSRSAPSSPEPVLVRTSPPPPSRGCGSPYVTKRRGTRGASLLGQGQGDD
jgi:hypothetical protein